MQGALAVVGVLVVMLALAAPFVDAADHRRARRARPIDVDEAP